jgi:hypothetical protein
MANFVAQNWRVSPKICSDGPHRPLHLDGVARVAHELGPLALQQVAEVPLDEAERLLRQFRKLVTQGLRERRLTDACWGSIQFVSFGRKLKKLKYSLAPWYMYIDVSSPPATEEAGAMYGS